MTEDTFNAHMIDVLEDLTAGETDIKDMTEFDELHMDMSPLQIIDEAEESSQYGYKGEQFDSNDGYWCYDENNRLMSIPDENLGDFICEQLKRFEEKDLVSYIEEEFTDETTKTGLINKVKEIFKNS